MSSKGGSVLIVLGVGAVTASLPDIVRFMVHEAIATDLVAGLILTLGAMMIASGLLLRRP